MRSGLVLLAFALLATSALAQKVCPLTQLPPQVPKVAPTRCVDAKGMTCCKDCQDIATTLKNLGINGSEILNQISPGLGDLLGGQDFDVCGLFAGADACQHNVEQMMCAIYCNPDSGNYLIVTNKAAPKLNICKRYSEQVYDSCKKLMVPQLGQTLDEIFPSPKDFLDNVFAAVVKALGLSGFNTAIIATGTATCYDGPKALPKVPSCCDSFEDAKTCPNGTVDFDKYGQYIGREVDPKLCAKYANITKPPAAMPPAAMMPSQPVPSATPAPPAVASPPPKSSGSISVTAAGVLSVILGIAAIAAF